jgi:N-acetylneuraminic acid mutarotase
MPEPLSFMAGALVGNTIYVAGGQHVMKNAIPSSAFWALDLSKRDRPGEFKWTVLPTWPGAARVVPIAAGQRAANGEELFLFSGRVQEAGKRSQILSDAYAFNPTTRSWRTLPKIGGDAGASVMAGMAAPVGSDEVLVFGGDRGDLFLELEAHDLAIEASRAKLATATAGERTILERHIEERLAAKRKIYGSHPGFGREVFAYDTLRDTWRVVTRSTVEPQVTTFAVRWGDAIVIPSGEIRPGVRTPKIVRAVPVSK